MQYKYATILELEQRLAKSEIPRTFQRLFDGFQIIYLDEEGNRKGSVAEHVYSCGLELTGFGAKAVKDHATIDEAFELFEKEHEKRSPKKVINNIAFRECPTCGHVDVTPIDTQCERCGQALDWKEEEEK